MTPIAGLIGRGFRAFPSGQLGNAAVVLAVLLCTDLLVLRNVLLTVGVSVGWILLLWRVGWEATPRLRLLSVRSVVVNSVSWSLVAWTLAWVGPLLLPYPRPLFTADVLVAAVAFGYVNLAAWAPHWLVSHTGGPRVSGS